MSMGWITAVGPWHWVLAAIVLIILEAFSPSAFFIWLSIAAGTVGLALAVFPALGWQIQPVLFSVLSVLSLVLGRRYLKRHPIATDTPTLNATTGLCCWPRTATKYATAPRSPRRAIGRTGLRSWPASTAREVGAGWACNDQALVAVIMNRGVSLGPDPEKRIRGEPVLETLDHAEAKSAAGTLADLNPDTYRPFNLVIADTRDAYWLRHGGDGEIRVYAIPPGLHMLSDTELDNTTGCPRICGYLQRFRNAEIPDPQHDH